MRPDWIKWVDPTAVGQKSYDFGSLPFLYQLAVFESLFDRPCLDETISLGKFENMLLSVDNFELSIFSPAPDITSVKPALGINCFGSFFWIFVITFLRSINNPTH